MTDFTACKFLFKHKVCIFRGMAALTDKLMQLDEAAIIRQIIYLTMCLYVQTDHPRNLWFSFHQTNSSFTLTFLYKNQRERQSDEASVLTGVKFCEVRNCCSCCCSRRSCFCCSDRNGDLKQMLTCGSTPVRERHRV